LPFICPSPPRWIHEYQLTPHSLYAAVSIGLECDTILAVLNRLSKNVLPADIRRFVRACTQNYGKVGEHDQNCLIFSLGIQHGGRACTQQNYGKVGGSIT